MLKRPITYDEVRSFMASRTQVGSPLGAMLDRMRDGLAPGSLGNWKVAQEREEVRRLQSASLIRCVDDLVARDTIAFVWAPDIRKYAKRAHLGEGEMAVRVLQAFEPWGSQWPEKGLAEAYLWLCSVDKRLSRVANDNGDEPAMAFRNGTAREARKIASSVVADAHVCLYSWVGLWDRKNAAKSHAA